MHTAPSEEATASAQFHPVLRLPPTYLVRDFTNGPDDRKAEYDVGRYDELRTGLYTTPLFDGTRCLHVGIDLGGPVGTPVMAYDDGELAYYGYMPADGDYGYVVVTRHTLRGFPIWALHGHLDAASIAGKQRGQRVRKGEVLGWLGSREENGGWPAHVHFQLSWEDPGTHDMPGVVDPRERESALACYPDPRLVLGPLY